MAEITSLVEQPKPRLTLEELEAKISKVYTRTLNFAKWHPSFLSDAQSAEEKEINQGIIESNSLLQELISDISRHRQDNEPIDVHKETNTVIEQILDTEKPQFYVSGVQMVLNGKVEGTSLYSTIVKARTVRDVLNKEYAKLKVNNYEAKIIQYPVF
jgi:hypothetical protein